MADALRHSADMATPSDHRLRPQEQGRPNSLLHGPDFEPRGCGSTRTTAGRVPHTADGKPWIIDVVVEFADERRAVAFEKAESLWQRFDFDPPGSDGACI